MQVSENSKGILLGHGWTSADIERISSLAAEVMTGRDYVMFTVYAVDGVTWLYPASRLNVFPLSLWRKIRSIIETGAPVVIPMDKNLDKVENAAKRYNGHLVDNMWLFGDMLAGVNTDNVNFTRKDIP
jgi:hypothetical protein